MAIRAKDVVSGAKVVWTPEGRMVSYHGQVSEDSPKRLKRTSGWFVKVKPIGRRSTVHIWVKQTNLTLE